MASACPAISFPINELCHFCKMVNTFAKRTEIAILFRNQNECARRTVAEFNERLRKDVSQKYVTELISKIRETASVNNRMRNTRRVFNDATEIEVQIWTISHRQAQFDKNANPKNSLIGRFCL